MRQFTCPKAVTHPSTNRARCRATALIETNALPLHQTANPSLQLVPLEITLGYVGSHKRFSEKNLWGFLMQNFWSAGYPFCHPTNNVKVYSTQGKVKGKVSYAPQERIGGAHLPLSGLEPVGAEPLMSATCGQCEARPMVSSRSARHYHPFAGTKLYCLVIQRHMLTAHGFTRQQGG